MTIGYIKKTSRERKRVVEIFPININIEKLHTIQGWEDQHANDAKEYK